jgi:hypothetical protein
MSGVQLEYFAPDGFLSNPDFISGFLFRKLLTPVPVTALWKQARPMLTPVYLEVSISEAESLFPLRFWSSTQAVFVLANSLSPSISWPGGH